MRVVVQGGIEWLKENGVKVIDLNSVECIEMLKNFTEKYHSLSGIARMEESVAWNAKLLPKYGTKDGE